MSLCKGFHSRTVAFFAAAFLALLPDVSDAQTRLLITSSYPEASTGRLFVYGEGFGTAAPTAVFAGLRVSV